MRRSGFATTWWRWAGTMVFEPPPDRQGAETQAPSAPAVSVPLSRLHPLTLLVAAANALRGAILPLAVIYVVGNRTSFGLPLLLVVTALSLVASAARYFTFTYRVEAGELITRQGILDRTERHIPLTRVQDVRMEQGVLHRLLGVVDVHIETAGGQGAEASLSAVGRADAERLRRAIVGAGGVANAPPEAGPPAAQRDIIRRVGLRELVVAGLAANHLASGTAIVFGAWAFLDDVLPRDEQRRYLVLLVRTVQRWWEPGGWTAGLVGAAFLGAVLLVGMLLSVAGSVLLFYGFTLRRDGEDLHRTYGLLTRRASRLPRRRIQLLKIEESAPRRLLGLATLHADTAGSAAPGGKTGRDVLLPVVGRDEVEALLPAFFPDVDPPVWRHVSRLAIRRETAKGVWACLLFAVLSFLLLRNTAAPPLLALWPLGLVPLLYGVNVLGYRHLGYALGTGYLRTRRGTLERATHVVPVRNLQVVVLRQTPFDRRLGLATLRADTAGQTYTGGGPQIRHLPWAEALALAQTLARQAARARYRW